MTKPALLLLQSVLTRIACARRTRRDLQLLRHSVRRACCLPPGTPWHRKAAAHAEFHRLLAEATGTPEFAVLAGLISGGMQDLIGRAGPAAEDLIIASRWRLLGHLEARDAQRAAREMEDHMTQLGAAGPGSGRLPRAVEPGRFPRAVESGRLPPTAGAVEWPEMAG
jgi:GntR family transcriptional regulator, transcriptional repressor for pyruvate dehydrogenase complex